MIIIIKMDLKDIPSGVETPRAVLIHIKGIGEVLVSYCDKDVVLLEDVLSDRERALVNFNALLHRVEVEQVEAIVHQRVGVLRVAIDFIQLARQTHRLPDQQAGLVEASLDHAGLRRLAQYFHYNSGKGGKSDFQTGFHQVYFVLPSWQVFIQEADRFFSPFVRLKHNKTDQNPTLIANTQNILHHIHFSYSRELRNSHTTQLNSARYLILPVLSPPPAPVRTSCPPL